MDSLLVADAVLPIQPGVQAPFHSSSPDHNQGESHALSCLHGNGHISNDTSVLIACTDLSIKLQTEIAVSM